MPDEPPIQRLVALARGRLSADEAKVLRAAIAGRRDLLEGLTTLERLAGVLDADAADPVSPAAIAGAKQLGRRLREYAGPSLSERISESIARLVRDTRFDAAATGLRGRLGFACLYSAEELEIDLECSADASGRFRIEGQVTGAGWRSVEFRRSDGTVVVSSIDDDGMFTASVGTGSFTVVLGGSGGRSVRLETLEIP